MYPQIPVLSLISAVLTLVPLGWYLRARNIPAVAIGTWLSITNVIYAVDALVWAEDSVIKGTVWCDISTVLITGSRVALPGACLSVKRRLVIFEYLMCFVIPAMYIALHLIVQPRRFDLFYDFGCRPATYPTVITLFLVFIPPLLLTAATVVFAGIAVYRCLVHGAQFYGKRSSMSSLTRNLYLQLVGMAFLEAVLSAVLIAVMMWGVLSPGLTPIANMPRDWSAVQVWEPDAITHTLQTVLETEWSVTVVQSLACVGLFACRIDVVREGWMWICTCLPATRSKPSAAFGGGLATSASAPRVQSVTWMPGTAEDDEVVIANMIDIPLTSPTRSSAMASSHNSLASDVDPCKLGFSLDAWPHTPTTVSVPCWLGQERRFEAVLAKSLVQGQG